jgi:hypothetical protein
VAVSVAITGCYVVLGGDDGQQLVIPFEEWNRLVDQIGRRTPQADRDCPP